MIPAAIQGTRRTGRTRNYTEQKVQTWMYTLAQQLERRRAKGSGGSEITLDQVWQLAGTRRCRALHALELGLVFGLGLGLLVLHSELKLGPRTVMGKYLPVDIDCWSRRCLIEELAGLRNAIDELLEKMESM